MLIAKIFVNKKQIDEIWIQNMGFSHDDPGKPEKKIYLYEIKKPKGHEGKEFYWYRDESYHQLLMEVLEELKPVQEEEK